MLPGRDLTKLSLLGFAFSCIPGKPSWLTKPRSGGGAFSVAGLCKDAAGLSVPLGDGWSAPRFWGLLTGKPTPPPSVGCPAKLRKRVHVRLFCGRYGCGEPLRPTKAGIIGLWMRARQRRTSFTFLSGIKSTAVTMSPRQQNINALIGKRDVLLCQARQSRWEQRGARWPRSAQARAPEQQDPLRRQTLSRQEPP